MNYGKERTGISLKGLTWVLQELLDKNPRLLVQSMECTPPVRNIT